MPVSLACRDFALMGNEQYSRNRHATGLPFFSRWPTRFTSPNGLASVTSRRTSPMDTASSVREFLFTLLLKVAAASSISALLARWTTFRRVLFTEQRDPDQKLKLMVFMTPPLLFGVTLRLVGGPIGGAIVTLPALISHEWLAMPAASTAGLLGGLIRQAIPNKEDLWNFGPFTFLNIPKATVRFLRKA